MATRQALRDLQQRIASLLQQASSEEALTASWLGVRLGGRRLLLPLQQAGEIYAMTNIYPLPYTKPWFLGVAHLRSNVYSVIDLGAFLPPAATTAQRPATQPATVSSAERGKARLIALNEGLNMHIAFRVDALEGLHSRDAFARTQEPPPNAAPHQGAILIDAQGTAWQEVNLMALVQDAQFLDIAADPASAAHALPH